MIRHIIHGVWIARLADPDDLAILDPDICLEDTRPVNDECVGDNEVKDFGVGSI